MKGKLLKDSFGWGFILWLIGYVLGIVLFAVVPVTMIGWIILPIGTVVSMWVAVKRVKGPSLGYYGRVAVVWTAIAVLGDYLFIVKAFKPQDGYYKPDVYVYYALTLAITLLAGWRKTRGGLS